MQLFSIIGPQFVDFMFSTTDCVTVSLEPPTSSPTIFLAINPQSSRGAMIPISRDPRALEALFIQGLYLPASA
jgi:hypothetical protein